MNTEITNSDSMFLCGCHVYIPEGKTMMQLDYCEDHADTGILVQRLRAERRNLELTLMRAMNRNLELRKQYNDAQLYIDDLVGVLREVLGNLHEDQVPTYQNVLNAIVSAEKRKQ